MSIAGVTGRVPVGAVLTIGLKGPSGAPTDRDRFYIKVPDSTRESARVIKLRPYNTARCAGCVKEGKTERNCPRLCFDAPDLAVRAGSRQSEDYFEGTGRPEDHGRRFPQSPNCPPALEMARQPKRLVMLSDGKSGVSGHRVSNDLCEFAGPSSAVKPQWEPLDAGFCFQPPL